MKKVLKPCTMMSPLPVTMVTVSDKGKDNIITVAWTGVINSIPPRVYISVRENRHSYEMINNSGEFVINLVNKRLTACADWCGIRSGSEFDKFQEMGLTKSKAQVVNAPLIEECPVNIECKVFETVDLGSHRMYLADVVAVNVDESIYDADGKIDMMLAHLVSYQHGEYYQTGRVLGRFGFAAQRKYINSNGKGVFVDMNKTKFTRRKPKK